MESVSRLSGLLETTRSLTLEASGALKARSSKPAEIAQLRKLLDSKHEREVLDGLRSIITTSQRDPDASPILFSAVLKNIANPSIPVKKLVYLYLLRYAESEPDTALLAINAIQKTLSATDPHVRALALRTMSGIRVPVISQIVSLAIKKAVGDMSPIVRKAAALAVPKCWRLDPSTGPQLTEYLNTLLGDRQYFVVGSAVTAFLEVCPDQLDLVHAHYRSLVKKLVDMDEWGQISTLRLMTRYVRLNFPMRLRRQRRHDNSAHDLVGAADPLDAPIMDPDLMLLLTTAKSLLQSRTSAVILAVTRLYTYCVPSTPSSPNTYLPLCAGPLVALLRSAPPIAAIALQNILQISTFRPDIFLPHLASFLVQTSLDSLQVQRSKLSILTTLFPIATPQMQSLILTDVAHFTSTPSPLTSTAIMSIGICASSTPPNSSSSTRCLKLLLSQIHGADDALTAQAMSVIRHLVQADPSAHAGTITRLAKDLDAIRVPEARASVIWLVGEFGKDIAADVFRILVKAFSGEGERSKSAILGLGAKVYCRFLEDMLDNVDAQGINGGQASQGSRADTAPYPSASADDTAESETDHDGKASGDISAHQIPKLWTHLLHLIRYDTSYSLRDVARVYKALLPPPAGPYWVPDRATTQLATLMLMAPKPVPRLGVGDASLGSAAVGEREGDSVGQRNDTFVIGTSALSIGVPFGAEEMVPEWVQPGDEPDPKLRDVGGASVSEGRGYVAPSMASFDAGAGVAAGAASAGAGGGANRNAGKSLDDWLDESEDDDEEEEEEEEESDDGDGEHASGESEEDTEGDSEESDDDDESDESDGSRHERANLMK